MTIADIHTAFLPSLENPAFKKALQLVKKSSTGRIWVTGGFVYRNIIAQLYQATQPYTYDIDFVVEHRNPTLEPAPGWKIATNSFGNKNYVSNQHKTSITSFDMVHRVSGNIVRNIDDYLSETPLNIQSLAYDLQTGELLGPIGLKAITQKAIRIHNYPQAMFYTQKRSITPEEYARQKASELHFDFVL